MVREAQAVLRGRRPTLLLQEVVLRREVRKKAKPINSAIIESYVSLPSLLPSLSPTSFFFVHLVVD
jgi:hypothetical protein